MNANYFIAVNQGGADDLLLALSRRSGDEVGTLLDSADGVDRDLLTRIGAVAGNNVTDAGKRLVPLVEQGLPCHLARVLTAANDLGCLADAVRLVALLRPGRTLRFRPPEPAGVDEAQRDRCKQADAAHSRLARTGYTTDLGRLLGSYDAIVDAQRLKGHSSVQPFCEANFLSYQVFVEVNRCHQGLLQIVGQAGMKRSSDRAAEDKLVLALLHGLSDGLCDYEVTRGHSQLYCGTHRDMLMLAPGSSLRGCADSKVVLSLFVLRGQSKRSRSGSYAMVTEAVEVSTAVLRQAEHGNVLKVHRYGHYHREWGHDNDTVKCRESWSDLSRRVCFSREGAIAPASEETGMAFALSLVGRPDPDDYMSDRKPLDPVVVAGRQLSHLSGGVFPLFTNDRLVAALGRKLNGETSWANVQRRKEAGELVIGWNDMAVACGMEPEQMASLRLKLETTCPTMVNIAGVDLPIRYSQGTDGQEACIEINIQSQRAVVAGLTLQHLPPALSDRTVRVMVTGIGGSSHYRGVTVSGSFEDLDGLRRKVETEVNRPGQPELPGKVGLLVREFTVTHPDGQSATLFVMYGQREPFTDRAAAVSVAVELVRVWLKQQAAVAASPYGLEDSLWLSALTVTGELSELPANGNDLLRVSDAIQSHVRESIQARASRRSSMVEQLKLFTLQARGLNRLTQMQGRIDQVQLMLGSSTQRLQGSAELDQAAELIAGLCGELPALDDDGSAKLQMSAQLEALRGEVKEVTGDLRQERRQVCDKVLELLQTNKLEPAREALAAAVKVFSETRALQARGQTRRLRGGVM